VLRRIFRPKREEVAGGRRELHNEEFHNLYASLNIIRMIKSRSMRWVDHTACMEGMIYAYIILIGKLEVKRLLVRSRRRFEDNIRMDQ